MPSIQRVSVPESSLLARYLQGDAYADCYTTVIAGSVSHADYVTAFYTSPVFKLERRILRWAVARPSTDAQARQLALGEIDTFSAWRVEARADQQLLLCDLHGRTRSWLMVVPGDAAEATSTRLYFGSAVVPVANRKTGRLTMGWAFTVLLGFHQRYSIVLLRSAHRRLQARDR